MFVLFIVVHLGEKKAPEGAFLGWYEKFKTPQFYLFEAFPT